MKVDRSYRFLDEHDFAIIDRTLVDEGIDDLPLTPLIPAGMNADLHLLPALLPLKQLTPSRRFQLLEEFERQIKAGITPIFSNVLDSKVSVEHLANHLKRYLILRQSDRHRVLFRYFDSRVFSQLVWMLDASKINQILGPVLRWNYLLKDRFYGFINSGEDENHQFQYGLKLDADDWSKLLTIGQINLLLDQLERTSMTDLPSISREIYELIMRAKQQHGLHEAGDQNEFALRGMTIAQQFDQHPLVSRALQELNLEEGSFRDAMRSIDEATWQQIAEKLQPSARIST